MEVRIVVCVYFYCPERYCVSWFVSLIRFLPLAPGFHLPLILVWKFAQLVSLPRASSHTSRGTNWVWKGWDNNCGWLQWLWLCRLVNYRVKRVRRVREVCLTVTARTTGGSATTKQLTNEWINLRSSVFSSHRAPISGKMFGSGHRSC